MSITQSHINQGMWDWVAEVAKSDFSLFGDTFKHNTQGS